jgi:hypothetical protein
MLDAAAWWKPDSINVLGDFLNCGSVSPHEKTPRDPKTFQPEVAAANQRLDDLDALGASEKHFVQGNHEAWLERYLNNKAPELDGLVDLRSLLNLDARGWSFTPYKQHRRQGKVNVTHECGDHGARAHMTALSTFEGNVVIGHTHRRAVSYGGNAQGDAHVGAMFGWLGDVTKVDYMHRIQALRGWRLGFGIGYQEANGTVHVQPVPIIDYRLVLEGRLFRG